MDNRKLMIGLSLLFLGGVVMTYLSDYFLRQKVSMTTPHEKPEEQIQERHIKSTSNRRKAVVVTGEIQNYFKMHAGELLATPNTTPHEVSGKVIGLRMINITKESVYTKLGLKNGQILMAVNNQPVKSKMSIFSFVMQNQGKNLKKVTVKVLDTDKKITYYDYSW